MRITLLKSLFFAWTVWPLTFIFGIRSRLGQRSRSCVLQFSQMFFHRVVHNYTTSNNRPRTPQTLTGTRPVRPCPPALRHKTWPPGAQEVNLKLRLIQDGRRSHGYHGDVVVYWHRRALVCWEDGSPEKGKECYTIHLYPTAARLRQYSITSYFDHWFQTHKCKVILLIISWSHVFDILFRHKV